MILVTIEGVADDLLAEADALEQELLQLEQQHNAFLDRIAEPWNELRAIAGLPAADLRKSIADDLPTSEVVPVTRSS